MDPEYLKIPDEILRQIQNPELIHKYILEGKPLRDLIGYSETAMENFYQAAASLLDNKRYKESQDAFLFLTTIDPHVYAYWLGLGISYQRMEDFEQAILSYNCASLLEAGSPIPHFYAAGCHHSLRQQEEARSELNKAREKALRNAKYHDYLGKIEKAADLIK